MKKHKKFLVVTGAGISAASGIPTFRGQDGFWKDAKHYAGVCEPTDICKLTFFAENPMAHWEWHHDFLRIKDGKVPNEGHKSIARF